MNHLPDTMTAWTKTQDEVGGFTLEEHPVPAPGPGEVLVKTQSTSVCGTDLHIWKWDEWSRNNVPLGTVTGHETSGIVVALGEDVNTHKIGDNVAIECHLACWNCPRCEEGNAHRQYNFIDRQRSAKQRIRCNREDVGGFKIGVK